MDWPWWSTSRFRLWIRTQLRRQSTVTCSPAGKHDWLQTWLQQQQQQQQQRGSNHRVGCSCALPGCASTTLISPIYRTHCIQSTHLLRTSARQNHSLLIAVVSEIESTAERGGGAGCEKEREEEKKNAPQKRARLLYRGVIMSSPASPHEVYLSSVIYSFPPFFRSIYPLQARTTHLENEPQKVTNWLFNHSLRDNKPYALHLPVWQVWKCELYKY